MGDKLITEGNGTLLESLLTLPFSYRFVVFSKGFLGGSDGKASACNAGDPGSIPGSGRSPGEKEMAIRSNTLAWKIPWTEEPDRLQSMGSQRVGHDWATSLDTDNFWVEAGCFLQSQSAFHHPDSCFSNISSWFMVTKNENLCCSASSPLSDTLVVILSCHLNATLGLTRTAFYKVDN